MNATMTLKEQDKKQDKVTEYDVDEPELRLESETYHPPSDPHVPGIPEVCLISPTSVDDITAQLNLLRVSEFQIDHAEKGVLRESGQELTAIILVPGAAGHDWICEQMRIVRTMHKPVILYQPAGVTLKQAHQYYDLGVHLILSTPASLYDIPRFMSAFIKRDISPDMMRVQSLEEAVVFRIRLEAHFDAEAIYISEYNGIISVSGFISSYWKRQYLCEIIKSVAGVKQLSDQHLRMRERPLENSYVNELVWDKIHAHHALPDESLLISSVDGKTTVTGAVARAADMRPVCSSLKKEDCIESINRRLIESKYYQDYCVERAEHIQELLSECDVPQSVRVAVCGSVVALSGYIPDEQTALELAECCLKDEGAQYVLNTCVINNSDYNYTNQTR